jgi:membrane protein
VTDAARGGPRADWAPTGADPGTSLFATVKRTLKEFSEDHMTDWAAALTYYGLLSLFPALIALVSLIGLVGDPEKTISTVTEIVHKISPSTSTAPFESVAEKKSASGILFVVGLGAALWSASGYVGAFMRASNIVWETPEGRGFLKLRPLQLLVTLVMIVLAALVLLSLVLTGPIVRAVAEPLGIGSTAISVWNVAKWPVLLVAVTVMFSLLYHASPNVKMPKFHIVSPGAAVAIVLWILVSALFAIYVANFGSFGKTYGTLGGVVALLMWVWLTNCALLFGLELNAERERSAELEAGVPRAEREIQLEPRSEPKPQQTTGPAAPGPPAPAGGPPVASDLRLDGRIVAADRLEVLLVLAVLVAERRRVLDLVLGALDVDHLVVDVDRRHDAGGDHRRLAEPERPEVDLEVGPAAGGDDVVDLAQLAVGRLDLHALEVGAIVADVGAECPEVHGHRCAPSGVAVEGASIDRAAPAGPRRTRRKVRTAT